MASFCHLSDVACIGCIYNLIAFLNFIILFTRLVPLWYFIICLRFIQSRGGWGWWHSQCHGHLEPGLDGALPTLLHARWSYNLPPNPNFENFENLGFSKPPPGTRKQLQAEPTACEVELGLRERMEWG